MERLSVLCLLLLCSLPGADLMNISEITEETEGDPERVNVRVLARGGPLNVHAVLREMGAKLTALQTKMETLDQLQANVEKLQAQNQVEQVAFSASLLASGSVTNGPFNTDTPLVFKHVMTNIGNAYSPITGYFTAPVRGAYHFEFYIYGYGHSSHATAAVLVKNGQNIVMAYEIRPNGTGTTSNGITLLLEFGDVVSLNQVKDTRIHDNESHPTTFSGHLLFTM